MAPNDAMPRRPSVALIVEKGLGSRSIFKKKMGAPLSSFRKAWEEYVLAGASSRPAPKT